MIDYASGAMVAGLGRIKPDSHHATKHFLSYPP